LYFNFFSSSFCTKFLYFNFIIIIINSKTQTLAFVTTLFLQ
jgi:hypothetical protein